jgi:hypothetical protein
LNNKSYWYSGALIAPRKQGYDVILTPTRWIHRTTERKAKWAATAYKTLAGTTYKEAIRGMA